MHTNFLSIPALRKPFWLAGLALMGLLADCQSKKQTQQFRVSEELAAVLPQGSTAHLSGRQLAQAYCSGCHLFPEPALLDKESWEKGVLPNMGLRLGMGDFWDSPFGGMDVEEIVAVQQAGIFADTPLVAKKDWEKIVAFYLKEAPEKPLSAKAKPAVRQGLPLFKEVKLPDSLALPSLITLVKVDAAGKRLFVGDLQNHLYLLDKNFKINQTLNLPSPPVGIVPAADGSFQVLSIGVITPSDRRLGTLTHYQQQPGEKTFSPRPVLDKLKRPVELVEADLNQDGLTDLVVAEHGHHTGMLSWYRNMGQGKYRPQALSLKPGTRQVMVRDINQDDKPDLLTLRGQGQEGIYLYLNHGKGRFEEKALVRFPPVYGSSYLEVIDFNQDGFLDLVYSNGDNGDFSGVAKSYHGIRIYLNDGKNNFRKAFFYPLHGATKVLARDFDQDGDLDLAAIAFFPDFARKSQESFVYLENKGKLRFDAATFTNSGSGHWLTMDAGDLDQDGDEDLVLGSSIQAPAFVPPAVRAAWFNAGRHIVVLQNQLPGRRTAGGKAALR